MNAAEGAHMHDPALYVVYPICNATNNDSKLGPRRPSKSETRFELSRSGTHTWCTM